MKLNVSRSRTDLSIDIGLLKKAPHFSQQNACPQPYGGSPEAEMIEQAWKRA